MMQEGMTQETMTEDPLYLESVPAELPSRPLPIAGEFLPSSRVPHLGHAFVFVSFAVLLLYLFQLILVAIGQSAHEVHAGVTALSLPKRQLAAEAAAYLVTLSSCFLIFPIFWDRGFLDGINWNGTKALRLALRLVSLGLSLGWMAQALSGLIHGPKSMPMDDFFRTPSDVWLVAAFGTLLAPLLEEITFRGFLLPAFAIAFDWLGPMLRYVVSFSRARLHREEPPRHMAFFRESASAGLMDSTGNLFFRSRTAIVSASIVSSGLFALMHADQLAHAWGALVVLFGVSLVLTLIRIQTRSLACSTIVHASYNLSVFITLFIGTSGFRHLDKLAR